MPFTRDEIERNLVDRFERMVDLFPQSPAIQADGMTVDYITLHRAMRATATALRYAEHDASLPVALMFPAGAGALAALLGVLDYGSFYAPLDPANPEARLRLLLSEIGPCALLCPQDDVALAERLIGPDQRVVAPPAAPTAAAAPPRPVRPSDPAYLMFTSGSTGTPKGVVQTHRNVLADIRRQTLDLEISSADRFGLVYPVSSSASVCHVFGALLNGACVCIWDPRTADHRRTAEWIVRERITILDLNVSLFRYVAPEMDAVGGKDSLRILSPGSEPVLRRDFELFRRHFNPECRLQNALGTTETRTASQIFLHRDSVFPGDHVPVGFDVDDKRTLLLDPGGQPVAHGEIGEIAIQSSYLSPGYWNAPDLNRIAFRPAPGAPDERIYLTGDFGRRLPGGELVHLGRRDAQVRIRGHRVELGEIENRLATHPAVLDAAVATHADSYGNLRLAAYLVLRPGPAPSIGDLRRHLAELLPAHMIPQSFQFLDSLPCTTTGKLDRRSLPPPPRRNPSSASTPTRLSPLESGLLEMWTDVLGLDDIGVDENFFELGGDSLIAADLFARIEAKWRVALPLRLLHHAPTPRLLGARISHALHAAARLTPETSSSLIRFNESGQRTPLIAIPGAAASALSFRSLARCLGQDQPVIALEPPEIERRVPPHRSVQSLADFYFRTLLSEGLGSPLRICGFSAGGLVAWELARRWLQAGETVEWLGLIDTPHPSLRFSRRRKRRRSPGAGFRFGSDIARMTRRAAAGITLEASLARQILLPRRSSMSRWQEVIYRIHARAAEAYDPSPIDISVTVFSATDRRGPFRHFPPDLGWPPYALRGLHVRLIAGNHLLLGERSVGELASSVDEALRLH